MASAAASTPTHWILRRTPSPTFPTADRRSPTGTWPVAGAAPPSVAGRCRTTATGSSSVGSRPRPTALGRGGDGRRAATAGPGILPSAVRPFPGRWHPVRTVATTGRTRGSGRGMRTLARMLGRQGHDPGRSGRPRAGRGGGTEGRHRRAVHSGLRPDVRQGADGRIDGGRVRAGGELHTSGRPASTRARATHCCWPPDSSSGNASPASSRPRSAKASLAAPARHQTGSPPTWMTGAGR